MRLCSCASIQPFLLAERSRSWCLALYYFIERQNNVKWVRLPAKFDGGRSRSVHLTTALIVSYHTLVVLYNPHHQRYRRPTWFPSHRSSFHRVPHAFNIRPRSKQLEKRVVEVGFLLVLVAATAAFHYTRDFHSAFPHLSGSRPSVERGPLYNYLFLLAASATAYVASRRACSALSSALPASVKSSTAARRAAIALVMPAAACALHVVAGSPSIGDHVAWKWLSKNWENNGEKDLAWCARLFVLLCCWQALFAVVAAVCRMLGWGLVRLVHGAEADGGENLSGKLEKSKVLRHNEDGTTSSNGTSWVGGVGNGSSSNDGGDGTGKICLDTSAPLTG